MNGGLLDPFGWDSFMDMRFIEAPTQPRYTLPDDVPPPPGMTRAEFAAWSRQVCGITCVVPPGEVLILNNRFAMVRPADIARVALSLGEAT